MLVRSRGNCYKLNEDLQITHTMVVRSHKNCYQLNEGLHKGCVGNFYQLKTDHRKHTQWLHEAVHCKIYQLNEGLHKNLHNDREKHPRFPVQTLN